MHTVHIYLEDRLAPLTLNVLKRTLEAHPHVRDVGLHRERPHDLWVEYDAHRLRPMDLLNNLREKGLHPDLTFC